MIKTFIKIFYYLLFSISFVVNCSFFLDNEDGPFDFLPPMNLLEDSKPPSIEFHMPMDGATGVDPNTRITVGFSERMNEVYTESAFSLSNTGRPIEGRFEWVDRVLFFIPNTPLNEPGLYTYSLVSFRAENDRGVNLLDDLRVNFSFNSDLNPPRIAQTIPVNGANGVQPNSFVTLVFDKPMDVLSVLNGLSASPNMDFVLPETIITDNNTRFQFVPSQNLNFGTVYTVTVPTTVRDSVGNNLVSDYSFIFTVGSDFESPSLSSLTYTSAPVGSNFNLDEYNIVNGMNKSDSLIVEFSEPVQFSSLIDGVSISPFKQFSVVDVSGNGTRFSINFSSPLDVYEVYNIVFSDGIRDLENNGLDKEYSYFFKINGDYSQKIRVRGVYSNAALTNQLFTDRINNSAPQLTTASCTLVECNQEIYIHFCYGEQSVPCFFPLTNNSIIQLSSIKVNIQKEFGDTIGQPEYVGNLIDSTPGVLLPSSLIFNSTLHNLDRGSTYLIRISGGNNGATDDYQNLMDQDYTFRIRFP